MIGSIAGRDGGIVSEPLPRVLLVEDDPVGRAFLAEALRPLPLAVDVAADCASALALAQAHRHALALLDLQLPDGDGCTLLGAIRAVAAPVVAVALTADATVGLDERLRSAGFVAVAHKPLAAATVRALATEWIDGVPTLAPVTAGAIGANSMATITAVSPAVALDATGEAESGGVAEPPLLPPLWDDADALSAAGGRREIVDALRTLLRNDLPSQRSAVAAALATANAGAALAVLHRLRAACGFCGAAALDEAVQRLERPLVSGVPLTDEAAVFDRECARLLE